MTIGASARWWSGLFAGLTFACGAAVAAQRTDAFVASRDHAAIRYSNGPVNDAVSALNRRIASGAAALSSDGPGGYLRSVLQALDIPIESQVAVFSQTSNQAKLITSRNPRAIFFNDTTAVGWVRGGTAVEVATEDPQQGVIFYTLDQRPGGRPQFRRDNSCLECHQTWDTLGVPGMLVLSTFQRPDDNAYAGGFVSDHTSPFPERWGGWYVTGRTGTVRHVGNTAMLKTEEAEFPLKNPREQLDSLKGRLDLTGYLSPFSDVVALMVLEHQTHGMNLLTEVGWESRVAALDQRIPRPAAPGQQRLPERVRTAVDALVDYLLFVDETPLPGKLAGTSGFAEKFQARGPRDRQGRSLRQLDLEHRLMRYPCSYMIYTEAFDRLPGDAREAVFERLWQILSGADRDRRYARLSLADRQAVVAILRGTRTMPDYFKEVTR